MDYEHQLEHFSLRWNNYNDNMRTGFHDLLRREDFVDVTIAAEGKLIQAHKMVLSICSPYFRNIFKANPCQHPVVFLKDVTHKELSGILQFMYLGEVSVQQEELGRFLRTAEALQIKGLSTEDGKNRTNGKQEEQFRCYGTNTQKTEVLPLNLPDRTESNEEEVGLIPNGITSVTADLPVVEFSNDPVVNHHEHESKLLLKNEHPELDFYDIECDQVSLREENSGLSDCHLQDNNSEMSDEVANSSGAGEDLCSLQGFNVVAKEVDGSQESRMSPALTKNQGICPICGKILQHRKNLQTHIIDQHCGIFDCWPCQVCHKVCRTMSALRVHKNRHHMRCRRRNSHS